LPLQEALGFLGLPAIPFADDGLQALDGGLIHAGEGGLGALDRCGFGIRRLDGRRWLRIDPLRWSVQSLRRGNGFGRESLGAQDVALGIRDAPRRVVDQPSVLEYEDPGTTLAAAIPGRRPAGPSR
jgi:hypothetical protein